MNAIEIIQHWIDQIKRIPSGEFIAITDFSTLPSRARTESLYWSQQLFSERANPHAAANQAVHSYYPAGRVNLDVLRHQYVADGNSITAYEGINFLIARIPAPGGKPWSREALAAVVQWGLNISGVSPPLVFRYPDKIAEGTLVSSDPAVDPSMMQSWSNRVDLLVQDGSLYIIAYKRYPGALGFLHDGQWFEDPLRSKTRP